MIVRRAGLIVLSLAVVSLAAYAFDATRDAPAAPSAPSASSRPGAPGDWMVIRMEYVQDPERYRLTVLLDGTERTINASRVCYEAAVPGHLLPETVLRPAGYEVECHVAN